MEEPSMPRRPRITLPGVPLHIIQRGNDRQACSYADEDYQSYLSWLKVYSQESKHALGGALPVLPDAGRRLPRMALS